MKNPENLKSKKNEIQRLNDALKLNEPLAKAYYLKDELRQFWSYRSKSEANANIMSWIVKAEGSGVTMLIQFAKTIRKQFKRIIAYYDCPISTGILEGTNNKIKTLTKQAYGYRDSDYFRLKLLALHRSKYQLAG